MVFTLIDQGDLKRYTQREILGFTDQSFFVKIVFTKILKFS